MEERMKAKSQCLEITAKSLKKHSQRVKIQIIVISIGKVTHLTVNFGHLRLEIFVSLTSSFWLNLILSHLLNEN